MLETRLSKLQEDWDRVKPLGYCEITACHQCQHETLRSSNFCGHCGERLRERCSACHRPLTDPVVDAIEEARGWACKLYGYLGRVDHHGLYTEVAMSSPDWLVDLE